MAYDNSNGPVYSQVVNKLAPCTSNSNCSAGEYCCSDGTSSYCGTGSCLILIAACNSGNNYCGTGNSSYNTATYAYANNQWYYGNATLSATYFRQQGALYCGGTFFNTHVNAQGPGTWGIRACS
jgi:hypothetical protein